METGQPVVAVATGGQPVVIVERGGQPVVIVGGDTPGGGGTTPAEVTFTNPDGTITFNDDQYVTVWGEGDDGSTTVDNIYFAPDDTSFTFLGNLFVNYDVHAKGFYLPDTIIGTSEATKFHVEVTASATNITQISATLTYSIALNDDTNVYAGVYEQGSSSPLTGYVATFTEDVTDATIELLGLTPGTTYEVKYGGTNVVYSFTTESEVTELPVTGSVSANNLTTTTADIQYSLTYHDDSNVSIIVRDNADYETVINNPGQIAGSETITGLESATHYFIYVSSTLLGEELWDEFSTPSS